MANTNVKITAATVLQGQGADIVILTTTLPMGVWPFQGYAQLKMEVACGKGTEYVQKNLGFTPIVINMNG